MTASASTTPDPSIRDRVSPEEWAVRVDLAAFYRLIEHFGWGDLSFTHISARVPGHPDQFLLNPYGMLFNQITASSLVKLDMEGNIVLDSGYPVNSAGFTIHSAVLMGRDDVGCAAHTHTVPGMAVSAVDEGLLPMTQKAMRFYDKTAYHDYEGVAVNLDERERLQRDLDGNDVMILRNHGLLACGDDVRKAFVNLYNLEKCCETQLAARATGAEIALPPTQICESAARQFEEADRTYRPDVWEPLLRRLDRIDLSYRH